MSKHQDLTTLVKRLFSLIGVFVVFFSLPLLGGIYWLINRPAGEVTPERTELISTAAKVIGDRSFVRIGHSRELNPQVEKDFMFSVWFNARKLPKPNERITLVSKYSSQLEHNPGYSIALEGRDSGFRILIYWKDAQGKGKWYVFNEFAIVPEEWFMVALTFIDGRYLGVYTVTSVVEKKADIVLAGGYDLGEEGIYPDSDSDIIIGATRNGQFKGSIGPYLIIQKRDVGTVLKDILKEISRNPREIPSLVAEKSIRLWAPNIVKDISRFNHPITLEGISVSP
jgi:hypothetical protein